MKQLYQPASLLLYLLSILIFFVVGASISGISGAGEGQGLAGGAIVFMYGVMTAFGALVLAFFAAFRFPRKTIIRTNQVFGVLLLIAIIFLTIRVQKNQKEKNSSLLIEMSSQPLLGFSNWLPIKLSKNKVASEELGMGFFKPNFQEHQQLSFYGPPSFNEVPGEKVIQDRVLINKSNFGDYEITEASPWLVPHHLKLDYGIMFFKVVSIHRDYLQIIVNTTTGQTMWVNRADGIYYDWPDFLLQVFSISILDESANPIRVKPLDHAGISILKGTIYQPFLIKGKWVKVKIYQDDLKELGEGWINWKSAEKLLIKYSLLS